MAIRQKCSAAWKWAGVSTLRSCCTLCVRGRCPITWETLEARWSPDPRHDRNFWLQGTRGMIGDDEIRDVLMAKL